jgi:hypothetical protein
VKPCRPEVVSVDPSLDDDADDFLALCEVLIAKFDQLSAAFRCSRLCVRKLDPDKPKR